MGFWRRSLLLVLVVAAAAAVPAGTAGAAVSTAHSGWAWGNPLPQGEDIQGLEFLGSRGYAAGRFGTLLRTEDAGASWTGIVTGLTQDLARVRIIDADSVVIAGGCSLRRSDDAGQTFARLPWTPSDLNCPAVIVSHAFPTEQVGYVVISNGGVFRTIDGGKSWTRKTAVPLSPAPAGPPLPTDLWFTGPDTGIATTNAGRIYRTTDGGGSWTLVATHANPLNGLFFADATTGYAVGDANSVLKSTNGGVTWAVKAAGGALNLTSIRCANTSICLVTEATGAQLLRTINGADAFTAVTPSSDPILAAAFASTTRAVAAGWFGTTVVSNDGGANWSSVATRVTGPFSRLRATSATLAVAAGRDGAIALTTNGGNSWTAIGVPTSGDVIDASFPSPTVGYALDSNGAVFKTDNGGGSWQILNAGARAPASLLALDPNQVLVFGRGVRRSTNGGGGFTAAKSRGLPKAGLLDFDRAGNSIFAFSDAALVVSTNGGKSWKKVKRPAGGALRQVDFVSRRRGFALTRRGRVFQTRNGGRRWSEVLGVGHVDDGVDLAFGSAKSGWILFNRLGTAGYLGYALRTSDGGKTWRPQLVDNSQLTPSHGLAATGDATGLVISPLSTTGPTTTTLTDFFTTASGGDAGAPTTLKLKSKKRTLRKRGSVRVTGTLKPAEGGEQVTVSRREGSKRTQDKVVTVASNGTFTTSWKIKRTSYFVAQWAGDEDRAGSGSKVFTVKVGRRRGR